MNLKFGTDGIRGPVESIITPEACLKIGHATGLVMKDLGWDTVVIGKDTRVSGYMLESALQAGFIAAGVNVNLLGPIPTPGVAYLTKTLRNKFGVVISASHNDFLDNGLGSTTHVSIIDRMGNASSITTTNGESCGHIIPGTGVILNNMLGEQDLNPLGFERVTKFTDPPIASPSMSGVIDLFTSIV